MNARVFPGTHGRPAPARRSLVYWEWIKNDQRVLAAGFLLPALLILASVVIYPFPLIVYFMFQRWLITGLTLGAVKG